MISPAISDTGRSSMRRGRGRSLSNTWATRPGRDESSTTRSARRAASRTLWVTNRTVKLPLAPEPLELVVEQVAGHGVERTERLVHEEDVGVLGEGPGQGDPLAHAAGELVGTLARRSRSGGRWRGARSTRSLRSRFGVPASLRASAMFWLTVSQGNSADSWNIRPVRPLTSTVPAVGLVEPGHQVEQGGLAAPRGADQADELAGLTPPARPDRGRAPPPDP